MSDDHKIVALTRPGVTGPRPRRVNEELIEQFDHNGVSVRVVQNRITKRYTARFEFTKPIPFSSTSLTQREAKRKAIKLIDKLHGA